MYLFTYVHFLKSLINIGDPISCISDSIPAHVMNTYCWITATFSLPENFYVAAGKQVQPKVAHPGLGIDTDPSKRLHHNYYQWVPFALFFQGLLFYLPHWLWKNWEEGKVKMMSEGLRGVLLESKNGRSAKINRLVNYIICSMHLRNTYAVGYFFCEVLNFVMVVIFSFFNINFLKLINTAFKCNETYVCCDNAAFKDLSMFNCLFLWL